MCPVLLAVCFWFCACNKKLETVHSSTQSSYYSADLEYPVYHGDGAEEFNKTIEQYLKKQMLNIARQSRLVCERDNEPGNLLPQMCMRYEVLQQDASYLTIRFSTYINWNNDFAPSLYYDCFNYFVAGRKFIQLQDYLLKHFANQDKAIKALSLVCRQKMYNEEEIYCKSILKADQEPDFFENFSLTDQYLSFKFDNVSLETNMCGNPEIKLTEKELTEAYSKIRD